MNWKNELRNKRKPQKSKVILQKSYRLHSDHEAEGHQRTSKLLQNNTETFIVPIFLHKAIGFVTILTTCFITRLTHILSLTVVWWYFSFYLFKPKGFIKLTADWVVIQYIHICLYKSKIPNYQCVRSLTLDMDNTLPYVHSSRSLLTTIICATVLEYITTSVWTDVITPHMQASLYGKSCSYASAMVIAW